MGRIEQKAAKRIRRRNIQDGVLTSLYAAAGFAIVLSAPNAARILKSFDPDFRKKRSPTIRIRQALHRLIDKDLITQKVEKDGKKRFILTQKGKQKARQLYELEHISINKPRRWDKRWRIVIFDIWENRRVVRNQLRDLLKKIGFVRIQNSVWAYPYDCEELLVLIRTDLRLGRGVLYFVSEGVENDRWLRKHFSLPLR